MKVSGIVLLLLIVSLIFSGCNLPQKTGGGPDVPAETPEETAEAEPEPTETPTPLPEKEKIVFIPSDEQPAVTKNLSRALEALCAAEYECVTDGSESSIQDETDFVILAGSSPDPEALAQRFPQAQVIAVTAPGAGIGNVWTIQHDEAFFPFLAGLAAASSALDWRSAGLIPNDSPLWGSHSEESFLNGAHYFCGNCMPALAPYVSFPLVISLPSDSPKESWITQFDDAQKSFIYTAFLSEESVSDALLQKLVSLNVMMLGDARPPAGVENNWLATVRFDWAETLRQIIVRSDAGTKQGTIPVVLSVVPGALGSSFSDGKTAVLREAYSNLLSGSLSPYTAEKEYTE